MEQRQLRKGYTTGTCASAAAKAAAVFLLSGTGPDQVSVCLPGGRTFLCETAPRDPEGELAGYWGVKKDSGDDPDVTNGTWICAAVAPVSRDEFERLCREGQGYFHKDFPGLYLNGGIGVGMVTKPGLACPPGHYAINPVPRAMIFQAVREAAEEWEHQGCLEIRLAVPDGQRLSAQTFNPRLGIAGGISILGTTGIVEPMSERALVETIRLDIRTKAWENREILLMTPGNYGSTYLKEAFGIPEGQTVKCSNFVAESAKILAEEGVRRLLFAGHAGKLVKVAGGAENTHSRYGDRPVEVLTGLAARYVESREDLERIRSANTTDEALKILEEYALAEPVLALGARLVKEKMEMWGKGRIAVEVIVFSSAGGLAGKTDQAEQFLDMWHQGIEHGLQ